MVCLSGCHVTLAALDGRDDYIAEIQVVFSSDSDKLPEGQGWELVEKSASGKSANLNKVSQLVATPWPIADRLV